MKKVLKEYAIKKFNKSLNSRIEPMQIDGLLFNASDVLLKCDYIAYTNDFNAWLEFNEYELVN